MLACLTCELCVIFRETKLYAIDFFLTLSELDICKSLRIGFDQSILREFKENSIQERPRIHGNLPLQNSVTTITALHHPLWTIQCHFSRGACGSWDNRSSSRSDKDGGS